MAGITGVIVAGGQARRMGGGDKCLLPFGNGTILDRVIQRLRPQVAAMMLNANGDPSRFAATGLPVAGDELAGHPGPLAGLLAGLRWSRENFPDNQWVVTVAADTPFFPLDLVPRLHEAVVSSEALAVVAASCGQLHPVFGLWHHSLEDDLRQAVVVQGQRKVRAWLQGHPWCQVEFPLEESRDPFFNINCEKDLELARTALNS